MGKHTLVLIIAIPICTLVCPFSDMYAIASDTSSSHIRFEANTEPTEPVDPTDMNNSNVLVNPDNSPTRNQGPLSIDTVPNIEFGEQKIKGLKYTYKATNKLPFVQITDNRGNGSGWQVNAKVTEFHNRDGTKILKGAQLKFNEGIVKSDSSNISSAPRAINVNLGVDITPVFVAAEGRGQGTWIDLFSDEGYNNNKIALTVYPGTVNSELDYNASITWELNDAPM